MLVSSVMRGLVIFLLTVLISFVVLQQYSTVEMYMDEIFHIPQAQHYCRGEFDVWNKGITTFPGLYWTSYAMHRLLNAVSPIACSAWMLRGCNVLMSSVLPVAAISCREMIYPGAKDAWVIALVIFLYPLNLFYYYLCYTDTISTVSLVLTYCLVLKTGVRADPRILAKARNATVTTWNSPLLLLLLASWCVLARQTNAVWLLFFAGTRMLQYIVDNTGLVDRELSVRAIWSFVVSLWTHKVQLLRATWPLLLPVLGFVAFVLKTGSIVLGDKENHKPVLHFAMLAHAMLVISLAAAPIVLCDIVFPIATTTAEGNRDKQPRATTTASTKGSSESKQELTVRAVLALAAVGALIATALVYSSYSHPFLESDNRHYVFYIWKRFLSHTSVRIWLSPVYALCAAITIHRLSHRGALWVLIFCIALVVTLVPTPLLEPRYFTPGVVVALLNSPPVNTTSTAGKLAVATTVLSLAAVNLITIFVFLYKPFTWVDGTMARFMY